MQVLGSVNHPNHSIPINISNFSTLMSQTWKFLLEIDMCISIVNLNLADIGGVPAPDCDFETALCGWWQSPSDDFDWVLHSGPTIGGGTGPSDDHTPGPTSGEYTIIQG